MRKLILTCWLLASCTENTAAKSFGGQMTVQLPCGEKLVDVTWKDAAFWYATRPMRDNENAETYLYREKSAYGIANGSVQIRECVK